MASRTLVIIQYRDSHTGALRSPGVLGGSRGDSQTNFRLLLQSAVNQSADLESGKALSLSSYLTLCKFHNLKEPPFPT